MTYTTRIIPQEKLDEFTRQLTTRLVDEGMIIEAGWVSLREWALPKDASSEQMEDMRMAFFAGAHHVFTAVLSIMEPGEEPTERDLARMSAINNELNRFVTELRGRQFVTKGSA